VKQDDSRIDPEINLDKCSFKRLAQLFLRQFAARMARRNIFLYTSPVVAGKRPKQRRPSVFPLAFGTCLMQTDWPAPLGPTPIRNCPALGS